MKLNAVYIENIKIGMQAIRGNLLRSTLTIFIIGIGIMALVGILTAIDAITNSINSEFAAMGANSFTIRSRGMQVQIGDERLRQKNFSYISYTQAAEFKEAYKFPAVVSISTNASGRATLKYEAKKTNPNIRVLGVDENYLHTAGHTIHLGRDFNNYDIESGKGYVILGFNLAKQLFASKIDPIQKIITIGNGKYQVIGVLKEKGGSMGGSGDDACLLPVSNVRQYFGRAQMSFDITVSPSDAITMEAAESEAEGVFRVIRNLTPADESDFNINKSDNLAKMLLENLSFVTVAATIIGFITLFGAAIGLMNIMLVAVSERTREIGTRKALGASQRVIRIQFLSEAIIIGQLGGILGIILGILMGNVVSGMVGIAFIIPWKWIIGGVVLCLIVSLASGFLPASKAAKLDPIEALRYE
ncbi:MAG TPA: ABC transporter [Bacteroidales bacterium]|nr:ABC transporter [Bacteroidales bacterium]